MKSIWAHFSFTYPETQLRKLSNITVSEPVGVIHPHGVITIVIPNRVNYFVIDRKHEVVILQDSNKCSLIQQGHRLFCSTSHLGPC